jgi:pimeloyl-ACP methyl ester carboxylesterase
VNHPIPAWPGELVSLPGGDVYVRSAPADTAGPATTRTEHAMFVHGLGGSATNWTDLMELLRKPAGSAQAGGPPAAVPALAGQAIDLPGFGFSPVPADGDYSIDAKARAVIELIEDQRRWPVHLVGNSLGGSVAVRVAGRRPDLVKTLTLVSPALPDLRPRLIPLRVSVLCVPGAAQWVMRRLDRYSAESRTLGTIQEVYRDPGLMHPLRYAEEAAEVRRRDELGYVHQVMIGSTRGLVREYLRPGPLSLWRDAVRVTAPTLVLYGSHDRLVRAAMAGKAARAFPAARVLVLPRMGHVAMMERPDLVAAAMWELLASVAGRTAKTTDTEEKRSAPQHAATQADTGAAG